MSRTLSENELARLSAFIGSTKRPNKIECPTCGDVVVVGPTGRVPKRCAICTKGKRPLCVCGTPLAVKPGPSGLCRSCANKSFRRCGRDPKNLLHKEFGAWKVVAKAKMGDGRTGWTVQCKNCDARRDVPARGLGPNRLTGHKGCTRRENVASSGVIKRCSLCGSDKHVMLTCVKNQASDSANSRVRQALRSAPLTIKELVLALNDIPRDVIAGALKSSAKGGSVVRVGRTGSSSGKKQAQLYALRLDR